MTSVVRIYSKCHINILLDNSQVIFTHSELLFSHTIEEFHQLNHEIADIRDTESTPVEADLVAVSSFSAQIGEAYELADRYRRTRG